MALLEKPSTVIAGVQIFARNTRIGVDVAVRCSALRCDSFGSKLCAKHSNRSDDNQFRHDRLLIGTHGPQLRTRLQYSPLIWPRRICRRSEFHFAINVRSPCMLVTATDAKQTPAYWARRTPPPPPPATRNACVRVGACKQICAHQHAWNHVRTRARQHALTRSRRNAAKHVL